MALPDLWVMRGSGLEPGESASISTVTVLGARRTWRRPINASIGDIADARTLGLPQNRRRLMNLDIVN
jgi:hypothetical protein